MVSTGGFFENDGTFQALGSGRSSEDGATFHFLMEIANEAVRSTQIFPTQRTYSRITERAVLEGLPSTILWAPGETEVALGLLLPAVQAAPRESSVGFPVGKLQIIHGDHFDTILIIAEDGSTAHLFDISEGALRERQTFTAPGTSRFASAWSPDGSSLQLSLMNEEGMATSLLDYEWDGSSYLEQGSKSFVLGNAPKTTIVAYTDNPLLNPAALEIERFAVSSWATGASLAMGQINATAESFGGFASGLSEPTAITLQPMNPANGVVGNQYELDSSICHVGQAGFSGDALVSLNPPPGLYTASTPVTFSASAETSVLYRIDGGPWQASDGGLTLTQSVTIDYYGQHASGLLSPIQSATYEIEQSFQFADSNNDGLPDAYATAFGLDPLGNGDADSDASSDFDELLGGTDPNDASDTPNESSLGTTVSFRILDAESDAPQTSLVGRITLFRLDGSYLAETSVSRFGTAEIFVPFASFDGLGIAMFEGQSEGSLIQMAAGIVGKGFPDLAFGDLSAEQWLTKATTTIGAFKSVTGMSAETEVIEISPQSTLGVLAFEAWLSLQLSETASKPQLVPPSSVILTEIESEVLITVRNDEDRAFELLPIYQNHHKKAGNSQTANEWHRALAILYGNRRASPLLALRRLFFKNEVPASYANELDGISLATLLAEKTSPHRK